MLASHQRIAYKRSDDDRAKFLEYKQNSKKFDSETSKLQPVNISETSRDTDGVHQRAANSLQSF